MVRVEINEIVVDGRTLSFTIEGDDAERLAVDLRDRFYRDVKTLDDPGVVHPEDAEPHPAVLNWERIAEEDR